MTAPLRSLVEYARFLEPLRDSPVAQLLWSKWDPESFALSRRRLVNLRSLFAQHDVHSVFDVGANIGSMTSVYLALGARVVSVEPDPSSVRRLRHRFRSNPKVTIEAVGAGSAAGVGMLHRYPTCLAYDTFSSKRARMLAGDPATPHESLEPLAVPLVTLDQLIAVHGRPDYIKLDVEGFEADVLQGLSQPVRVISFECNLPAFEAETLECIGLVGRLHAGYRYNVWRIDHTFELVSGVWLTSDEIAEVVLSRRDRFMEIVAAVRDQGANR
jgi:FkbM family methyltransferase